MYKVINKPSLLPATSKMSFVNARKHVNVLPHKSEEISLALLKACIFATILRDLERIGGKALNDTIFNTCS